MNVLALSTYFRYAIGGNDYGSGYHGTALSYVHRIAEAGGSWETRANYPMAIRENCIAADHGYDRMYSLGGYDNSYKRSEVYYYTVSSNSWSHHSNLIWTSMTNVACNIVTQKDGTRWILAITGGYYGRVIYYDLTNNNGWHHQSTLYGDYNQNKMSMISLTPSDTFLLGGYTQRNSYSTKNFWRYDVDEKNFYDTMHYIRNEHGYGGFFTKAKKTTKALTNCLAERTYAEVGWGGHTTSSSDYSSYWETLLRKRRVTGDPRPPAKCNSAIPNLSPGRYMPGDT